MTHTVLLVRHGRTALNADGRLRGHLDPPLDQTGEQEAAAVAAALGEWRIVKILSSPLLRALQTADAVAHVAGVSATAVDELVDRDYGPWAGELEAVVVDRFGSLDAAPDTEPVAAVAARALRLLQAQLPVLDRGDVVLVTHDAVAKALLGELHPTGGRDVQLATGSWSTIRRTDTAWQITCLNQRPLLTGRGSKSPG